MPPSPPADFPARDAGEALRRGQAHEARGEIPAALAAYDEAIAALRALPPDHHETRRQLGVAWMNRGNALQKIATTAAVADAITAYDEAIAVLHTLPCATVPAYLNHLGAAWLNRGHALLAADAAAAATASFERAIALLRQLPIETEPAYRLNLAGAWTNLAHAALATSPEQTGFAARAALALVAERAPHDLTFAAMSLRARRALVTGLGELLVGAASPATPAAEASDAIDDGLALARDWETRGVPQLRPLAARLFRIGAQLYRIHQPHFLAEFLLENLAPGAFAADATFRAIADEAIAEALDTAQRPRLLIAGDPDAEKLLATVRSLRAAQRQLATSAP